MDIKIVTGDLKADADWWDQISEAMNKALGIMEDYCVLPYATLDGISEALQGRAKYENAHEQMTTLLRGGVTETASIATRLRTTADNIVAADAEATP